MTQTRRHLSEVATIVLQCNKSIYTDEQLLDECMTLLHKL